MTTDPDIQTLREMVAGSDNIVIFTGAGISTESGIPDFRSPGGIWTTNQPVSFQDFIASEEARRETWKRKIETDKTLLSAEPNAGHLAVAKLVIQGKVRKVITQNIDGLHQAAGVPDDAIIEIHGNTTYAACLDCKKRYELEPIKVAFEADGTLPVCEDCGGHVKTATISFGQPMPEAEMIQAQDDSMSCDLFIAIGSSLVVYPAAGLPVLAKQSGAKLVILTRDPTELDGIADLTLNLEIGPTLSAVLD
ncbi:MAG: Sir2 family NAD-dependent protein deacetylase [Rhodospirillaceae bacterium]